MILLVRFLEIAADPWHSDAHQRKFIPIFYSQNMGQSVQPTFEQYCSYLDLFF